MQKFCEQLYYIISLTIDFIHNQCNRQGNVIRGSSLKKNKKNITSVSQSEPCAFAWHSAPFITIAASKGSCKNNFPGTVSCHSSSSLFAVLVWGDSLTGSDGGGEALVLLRAPSSLSRFSHLESRIGRRLSPRRRHPAA